MGAALSLLLSFSFSSPHTNTHMAAPDELFYVCFGVGPPEKKTKDEREARGKGIKAIVESFLVLFFLYGCVFAFFPFAFA